MSVTINSHSQPRAGFELLSEFLVTGAYQDFDIEGPRLYAATGYGAEILDISDPDYPQFLGRISTAGEAVFISVQDEIVYIADLYQGLHAFDVSDVGNIRRTWTFNQFEWESTACRDLQIHDDRLYACVWNVGVMIFDLSDPAHPEFLTTYEESPYPGGIDFQDTLAFIIDNAWESYLVADLRDTDDMLTYNRAGRRVSGFLMDVCVHEELLLLAKSNEGVTIYGIQQPLEPRQLQSFDLEGNTLRVVAGGDFAYASCSEGGLQTIDISDPDDAALVDVDNVSLSSVNSFMLGNNSDAFSAGGLDGMIPYDLSDPAEPEPGQLYRVPPVVLSLGVYRETAYIARSEEGLMILDVENPRRPRIVSQIDSFEVTDVFINEDWLYLTTYNCENNNSYLQSWHLHDPHRPEPVWIHPVEDEIIEIKIWDELLYLQSGQNQLEIWDISDPDHPERIGEVNDIDMIAFDIRGDFLYGISSEPELFIVNLYNHEEPEWLGSIGGLNAGHSISSRGSRVFIADGNSGIRVFDVSNAIRINEIYRINTHNKAVSVLVKDELLWVCDYIGGLQVYQNDLEAGYPELGFIDTYGHLESVAISDDVAFLADSYSFVICRFDSTLVVDEGDSGFPANFTIYSAFPNPFNSWVQVGFYLQSNSLIHATIFDVLGRQIYSEQSYYPTGQHNLHWRADGISSGSYLLNLKLYAIGSNLLLGNESQKLVFVR